jgi:hypothetical protein
MVNDILLAKAFNSENLYFIFMNADNKLIDTDWEAIRADYYRTKGVDLRPAEKKKFIVIFSPENGFIWIEKEQLYKFSRPLTRSEISNTELNALNQTDTMKSRYINNDYYYANVYDFLNETGYKPNID